MAVAEPQASTCLGGRAETPAKLSLSTERLAKSDDAARRDEASRGRGGSTNDQTRQNVEFLLQAFGFQLRPTTQRPAPNRPCKRTAGAFPSCPLAEPGVEIMAQTDAGRSPPFAPLPHSQFIFLTRCPWEGTGTLRQWAVQKSLCPGQGRKPQRARHPLFCPPSFFGSSFSPFWTRLSSPTTPILPRPSIFWTLDYLGPILPSTRASSGIEYRFLLQQCSKTHITEPHPQPTPSRPRAKTQWVVKTEAPRRPRPSPLLRARPRGQPPSISTDRPTLPPTGTRS